MATDVAFACRCGAVTGRLTAIGPAAGTRLQCHCRDCRDAVVWSGGDDPGTAGVGYFQTTPDRVVFESGRDRLGIVVWRGTMFRWQAACCGTLLFHPAPSPGVPFDSAPVDRCTPPEAFGKVVAHAFLPRPGGGTRHSGAMALAAGLLTRSFAARLSGRWRQTPFFDPATRRPVAEPRRLTAADRAARPA